MLFVQNVESLKVFYQQNFGFQVLEEIPGEWVVLKTGNCEIALHRVGEPYRGIAGANTEYYTNVKLVFDIDSPLHVMRETLVANNVNMRQIKSFGSTYIFCDGTDIEGNVFQLRQRLSASEK